MFQADQIRQWLQALSQCLGWTYTLLWSASFYPQPLLNWKRRSTRGTSIDFPFLNLIGFLCYTTSTWAFLYSLTIRSQYAVRHPISLEPTTRFNDFAFGAHAFVLCSVCYSQYFESIWRFDIPKSQRVSRPIAAIVTCCGLMVSVVVALMLVNNGAWHQNASTWAWIDVIYAIGDVKLIGTFVKYVPQVVLNYQRKSTVGWSIVTIFFDVSGGMLSLAQLIIDAGLQNDWSGIAGNPVKLGLSNISICFDIIFMVQHYILYPHSSRDKPNEQDNRKNENAPLLESA